MTDVSAPTPTPPANAPAGAPFLDKYASKIEDLQAQDQAAFNQEQSALAPKYSALNKTLLSGVPAPPQQEKVEAPPNPEDYKKNSMEWAGAMAVLGAVASKFTRQPGNAALNAFSGALKGWQQGNMQAYEDAAKEWEQANKKTIENNKMIMDRYKQILEDRKLNIDNQMASIQLVATQFHDKMMFDAAAAKNYTLVAQIYEKNQEHTDKAADAAAKLQATRDKQKTENEQKATYWLSPEGQQRFQQLDVTQQAAVKQLIDLYAAKNAKPQNAAMEKFLEENPNATAQEIQHFQQASRPPRSASAMSMQKFLEENPNATASDIQAFQAKQAELSAEGRTKGTRESNLDIILRVTDSAIPAALQASENVPRGSFVPLTKLIQGGQVMTSDVNLAKFAMANLQLAEGWARAMNPTGVMRESDRDKALTFLSTATSQETYKALVEQLRTQIQRERAAIQSGKQSAVSAPGEVPSASESTGAGWTDLGNGVRIREKP